MIAEATEDSVVIAEVTEDSVVIEVDIEEVTDVARKMLLMIHALQESLELVAGEAVTAVEAIIVVAIGVETEVIVEVVGMVVEMETQAALVIPQTCHYPVLPGQQ